MKKLISIGVALALLTMAVVPGAVAAQPPSCPPSNYTYPTTFAKIPFAIVQSGLELVGDLLGDPDIAATLGLPDFIAPAVDMIAPWVGGPLSWTVDMLGWGLGLVSVILGNEDIALALGLPDFIGPLVDAVVCHIFAPFDCIVGSDFDPCPAAP